MELSHASVVKFSCIYFNIEFRFTLHEDSNYNAQQNMYLSEKKNFFLIDRNCLLDGKFEFFIPHL